MKIASPVIVRNRLKEYAKRPVEVTPGDRGVVVGEFNKVLEHAKTKIELTPDAKRYLVWGFCFTPLDQFFEHLTSEKLHDGQFFALKKWIGMYKDENDEWARREEFQIEARYILSIAEMIHQFQEATEIPVLFSKWLADNEGVMIEMEPAGVASSAVNDLGGVIHEYEPESRSQSLPDPIDGYVPL